MSEIDVTYCKFARINDVCASPINTQECKCSKIPIQMCYYKQLQQLKADKEYEKKCKEDFQDKWRVLYDENEELKEEIDGLKRNILEKENCSPRYYLVTTHREWNELYKKFNYQREQKNKYKQCLDEIEEICKENYYDDSWAKLTLKLDTILQKIKQTKESEE